MIINNSSSPFILFYKLKTNKGSTLNSTKNVILKHTGYKKFTTLPLNCHKFLTNVSLAISVKFSTLKRIICI